MAKEKDLIQIEHFDIKITVEGRAIEILIHATDGCDALEVSGVVIRHLRIMGTEPKGVVLP